MKKFVYAVIVLLFIILSARPAAAFDPRASQMRKVLEKYHSPMIGLEDKMIATADKYGLDWTMLAAIAGTESSFGKRMPANCINPYGWGIYGDHRICFESFEKAIDTVGEGLGKKYNKTSVSTIAHTYNTVSTDGWTRHTNYFMDKIKNTDVPVQVLPITL